MGNKGREHLMQVQVIEGRMPETVEWGGSVQYRQVIMASANVRGADVPILPVSSF